jgi:hypothetical protein
VTQRLVAAVQYYEKLSGPTESSSAPDGQAALLEVADLCRVNERPIWIGFTGGEKALKQASDAELLARTWKWRTAPGITKKNWIPAADFLALLLARWPGHIPPPPMSPSRYDRGLSLKEVRQRCASTSSFETFVGYQAGVAAFGDKTRSAEVRTRMGMRNWKWHNPRQHGFLNTENARWIGSSAFILRVDELESTGG